MGGLGNVVYLNVVLMIYCSAVNSAMGIVSQIFDERGYLNLGNTSLFVIYLASGVNNLLVSTYVKTFSYRKTFLIASLGYLFFLAEGIVVCSCSNDDTYFYCNQLIIFAIIIIGSLVCGFLASILYVLQNEYISANTNAVNKSLYYGIAWALLQSSYIVGNIYSMFFIEPLGQFGYFCLMTGIAAGTSLFFFFVQKPIKSQTPSLLSSESQQGLQQEDRGQGEEERFEENNSNNNECADQVHQPHLSSPPADVPKPLKEQLIEIIEMMKTEEIRPLLYYMFSSGIIMSFGFGSLYRIVKDSVSSDLTDEQVDKKTFTVNIVLGCFEFLGGALVTPLADRLSKKRIAIATNLLFEAAIIASIIANYEKNYFLCFVAAALWGMTDCTTQSMNCNLLSTKYGDDVRPFAIWNLVQCIGAFIGMVFSIVFKQVNIIYYLLVVAGIQMITNIALSSFKMKSKLK